MTRCLDSEFYSRPTLAVARDLVGMRLVRTLVIGRETIKLAGKIVETEAYGAADDPASHARMGPTKRNAVMFGQTGRAYVYFTYGSHHCLNVSARSFDENAGAVLLRAIEPEEGVDTMKSLRRQETVSFIASGPGRLAQALAIEMSLNGLDMTSSKSGVHVEEGIRPRFVYATPRIGISRAVSRKWRFVDPSSAHLSRKVQIKV